MTTQLNIKFQDSFLEIAKKCASAKGYMSIQEFIREAVREKITENLEVNSEYLKILRSKEANTFKTIEDSKKLLAELKRK